MKPQVTAIVENFENETITEADALARLRELTGRDVDGDWLLEELKKDTRIYL